MSPRGPLLFDLLWVVPSGMAFGLIASATLGWGLLN